MINIKNRGVGIPDGGLFTPDQFQRSAEEEFRKERIPPEASSRLSQPAKMPGLSPMVSR